MSSKMALPGDTITIKMILDSSKRNKGFCRVYSGVKLNTKQAFYKFTLQDKITN